MRPGPNTPPLAEYIALVALMISIVALATDLMLPALDDIGRDLSVANANDAQMVVSAFFLGLAAGQMFVGPLSDSFGRKPVIYAGYALFVLGCILSMVTTSWSVMLLGRALQGLGAAAPRVVTVALVRDSYQGRAMARIMSFVMAVFILVPALAPAIGQGLVHLGGWRATFAGLIVPALVALIWFRLRMPETQPRAQRPPFSVARITAGLGQILRTRSAMGYTVSAGLIFGAFLGYLSSAQQVFQTTLQVGERFPLYFGIAALSVGASSVVNSRLVMRLGMRRLSRGALIGLTALSIAFLAPLAAFDGVPPLPLFMAWQLSSFFCIGILFGNLTALSMEDLGELAGLGAAFVGSLSTFMALPLGWAIGNGFDGTVIPLVTGFAVLGGAAMVTVSWTGRAAAAA
ncbi:MFS transporter [Rhodobacteraceae bacterium 2CG4]|uniref:MFS transporter n=1 Tax=Halovulum marinum TaxID=2662447 RepID=A0A6L5YYF1_9RHOB|nr:multidrug effflux MFS transporter [Halovulum marinum]MSU89307.1 MFS transporter [Halovulum marinum]